MLMYKKEYFEYIDKINNPYIKRNKRHFILNDTFRVGYSTYVRPPTNPYSDSFKYTILSNKRRYFNLGLNNIMNIKHNKTFRNKNISAELRNRVNILIQLPKTYQLLETVIPFLKNDVQISQTYNRNFTIKENIRGLFHIIFESYPNG